MDYTCNKGNNGTWQLRKYAGSSFQRHFCYVSQNTAFTQSLMWNMSLLIISYRWLKHNKIKWNNWDVYCTSQLWVTKWMLTNVGAHIFSILFILRRRFCFPLKKQLWDSRITATFTKTFIYETQFPRATPSLPLKNMPLSPEFDLLGKQVHTALHHVTPT